MKKVLFLAALAALFAFPVEADDFREGGQLRMNNVMLCDELQQIEAILHAAQSDAISANRAYATLAQKPSPHGGRACFFFGANSAIPLKLVKNISEVDGVDLPASTTTRAFIIEVQWMLRSGAWVQGFIFADQPLAKRGVAL